MMARLIRCTFFCQLRSIPVGDISNTFALGNPHQTAASATESEQRLVREIMTTAERTRRPLLGQQERRKEEETRDRRNAESTGKRRQHGYLIFITTFRLLLRLWTGLTLTLLQSLQISSYSSGLGMLLPPNKYNK